MCIAFGLLYVFVAIRRREQRAQSVLFAVFALAYAGTALAARSAFIADSSDQWLTAIRISWILAPVTLMALLGYVAYVSRFRPRPLLLAIVTIYLVAFVAAVSFPTELFGESAGVNTVTLPWGEIVRVFGPDPTPLFALTSLALFATLAYFAVALLLQYRRGERRQAGVLAIGLTWFAFVMTLELLATFGILDIVPTADFGFLGFVVAIVIARVDARIELERELVWHKSHLQDAVSRRTVELEKAQAELVRRTEEEAALAERSRLARELHDVVSQLLFSINLIASSLPRVWRDDQPQAERSTAELQRLAKGALAEMRILLRELRPGTIDGTDLGTLVTQLSDGLGARHDIPIEVKIEGSGSVPPDVHLALYRIAQEAMTNVAKHADASHVAVALRVEPTAARLMIRDDGSGFDPSSKAVDAMGLEIVRERADSVGASVAINSSPGRGTDVEVSWRSGNA